MKSRACIVLAVLALAAGCSKESTAPVSAPANTTAAPKAAEAPAAVPTVDLSGVTKAPKAYKLALVVKTRNNPFFDPMIKGAEAEAKKLGVSLEVQAPAQETDKQRQFDMVQDITAKGVDAILIAPADSKGIVPALKKAQDKGILVVNIDNRVDPATASAAGLTLGGYVGADNERGGQMAGAAMVRALGGQGKVAVLEGIRGTDNAEARKRGFAKGIQGSLQIAASDTAEWMTEKAYAKFQSMLAANPDIRGLFCANDMMALGAMKAIQEAGRKDRIRVIGYDNLPQVQAYLKTGALYATIDQHPEIMGQYGVRMAVGILAKSVQPGGQFLAPLELITKEKAK